MPIPRRTSVKLTPKVLYLTEDAAVLERQLAGEAVDVDPARSSASASICDKLRSRQAGGLAA